MAGDSSTANLETALFYKAVGNEKYKAGEYKAAIGQYHRAIMALKAMEAHQKVSFKMFGAAGNERVLSVSQQREVDAAYADCHANLAACLLSVNPPHYERVVECCNAALTRVPKHIKAHYRRGVALFHLHNFDDALVALNTAAQLQNKPDASVTRYMTLCRREIAVQDKKLRSQYQAMFNKQQ